MRYKRVELEEGVPVQFLGIYATRWPFDSGVEPTVGFIEDDEELEERHEREYGEWEESLRIAGKRIEELEGQLQVAKWLMQFAVESWDVRFDIEDYTTLHHIRLKQIREWLKDSETDGERLQRLVDENADKIREIE